MTQMQEARAGRVTMEMRVVAEKERVPVEKIMEGLATGRIVILANGRHKGLSPEGIGEGLRTKVNANIGTSGRYCDIEVEIEKARQAIAAGADTVMDLSTGGDIDEVRRRLLKAVSVPVGTVPVYQAGLKARAERGAIVEMEAKDIFEAIRRHAEDGVDFITVHCGMTRETVEHLLRAGRTADVVSRGGSFLLAWILHHDRENPLYEDYDRLLDIAEEYDLTLSLGDGLRPGSLADATDRAQVHELIILGELVKRARERGVQAMVEGPGHVPIDQIEANVILQKRLCDGAPFYVLGPLVTDVAAGYDHIAAAIGGAIAASAGADFLCYVTPAEHLSLPDIKAVKEGVIASRIAAHAGDIGKGLAGALEWDREMSLARRTLDWRKQERLAIDPEKVAAIRCRDGVIDGEGCSMCGDYCALRIVNEFMKKYRGE